MRDLARLADPNGDMSAALDRFIARHSGFVPITRPELELFDRYVAPDHSSLIHPPRLSGAEALHRRVADLDSGWMADGRPLFDQPPQPSPNPGLSVVSGPIGEQRARIAVVIRPPQRIPTVEQQPGTPEAGPPQSSVLDGELAGHPALQTSPVIAPQQPQPPAAPSMPQADPSLADPHIGMGEALRSSPGPALREIAADVARQVPAGIVRGIAGIYGTAGDLQELAGHGLDWVAERANENLGTRIPANFFSDVAVRPHRDTSSRDALRIMERHVTGPLPQPQTFEGAGVGRAAELGPVGMGLARLAGMRAGAAFGTQVVAPVVAGEVAAGLARGTTFEAGARSLGTVAGAVLSPLMLARPPAPRPRQRTPEQLNQAISNWRARLAEAGSPARSSPIDPPAPAIRFSHDNIERGAATASQRLRQFEESLPIDLRTTPDVTQYFIRPSAAPSTGELTIPQRRLVIPGADFSGVGPYQGRMAFLRAHRQELVERLASRLRQAADQGDHTLFDVAAIHQAARAFGASPAEAALLIDRLARNMAAASPRAPFVQNVRNATYLSNLEALGLPLSAATRAELGNPTGYRMLNLHYNLAGRMLAGDDIIRNAPKVTSVLENARGNRMVPVVDVHEVRGVLHELNQLRPGELPRGWFRSDAWYRRYREDPLNYDFSRGINDRLGYVTVNGTALPVEYAQFASILEDAATAAGRDPAVAHRVGRELRAVETGFRSPGLTLEGTLNARLNRAVAILGEPPDRVFQWFIRNQIPLSVAGGTIAGGTTLLDSSPSRAALAEGPLPAEERQQQVDALTRRLLVERSRREPR